MGRGHRGGGPRRAVPAVGAARHYRTHIDALLSGGHAYHAFETAEELEAQRARAEEAGGGFRYRRPERTPSAEEAERARAEGRPVVVRFRCPDRDVTVVDENFGAITVPAAEMEDFVIRKSDGFPTFYLANVVDDALMGVGMVCRGQEFLGQTWRQALLREALGFPHPRLLHLPLILDLQGRKLSKRDGDVDVHSFRAAGYLPEALLNFIALLGWNPGTGREKFSLEELVREFDPKRLGKANAKFDREKLLAFNTDAIAAASPERLAAALKDYLTLNPCAIPAGDEELLRRLVGVSKGIRTLADLRAKCEVLFGPDDAFHHDPKAVADVLAKNGGAGYGALAEVRAVLAATEWTAPALEAALKTFCDSRGLKMNAVAQPIRVAVAGRPVSPPIHDTLLFLGKPRTLARIDRCLAARAG